MASELFANLVLALHVAFVSFVVAGGVLVLWWPGVAWAHIPCALWGAWVEISGWVCPLTPLEVSLRRSAGEAGYTGGFLQHYVVSTLYPAQLTRGVQIVLGVAVLAFNLAMYALVLARRQRAMESPDAA
ncbi:MAG: DUF2784 domain-containing protein [Gemmatimonadetes bacterium]|nr:DUF2784 domain-containing protein [Gemmatimonadota bacterium]